MSDLNVPVRRLSLLGWPITALSGVMLCIVTLSIAQALRSHGIIVLVVSVLAVSGIAQAILNRTIGKVVQTFQISAVCLVSSFVLWVTGFLPSLFFAGSFFIIQICAVNTRNEIGYAITGASMIFVSTAAMIAGLSMLADLTFEIVLLLMCLASLVIALCNLSFRKQQPTSALPQPITCLTAVNTVDLWLALILLTPSDSLTYFSARLLTLLLPTVLHAFELLVAPSIYQAFGDRGPKELVHAMARVNLSLFLVAAGLATLTLTAQSTAMILMPKVVFPGDTAAYLLLAMFIPATLGQTVLSTHLLVPKATQNITLTIAHVIAAALLAFQEQVHAHDIALAYLVARTFYAAVLTMHIIKNYGIWPGPTALVIKQIRLFG